MADLSPRQKEVATLVSKGMSSKAIARQIDLSVDTINKHIQTAAQKLPGDGSPRHRLTCWAFGLGEDSGG